MHGDGRGRHLSRTRDSSEQLWRDGDPDSTRDQAIRLHVNSIEVFWRHNMASMNRSHGEPSDGFRAVVGGTLPGFGLRQSTYSYSSKSAATLDIATHFYLQLTDLFGYRGTGGHQ